MLNVLGPVAGDFSLSTSPAATVTLGRGVTTQIAVGIERSGGNASHVALAATGAMPYGMNLTFSTPNPTGGPVLSIRTSELTPGGTYPIVIHGNSFPLPQHVVHMDLVVPPFGGAAPP